jgi:arginine decarboxylase
MTMTRTPPATADSGEQEQWTIESARTLYNIEGWGVGFFDINEKGHVVVRPDSDNPSRELDLFELANDLEAQGVGLPLLLRFSDVLRSRIESLNERFSTNTPAATPQCIRSR